MLCPIIPPVHHHPEQVIAHLLPPPAEESYHLSQSATSDLDAQMFHGSLAEVDLGGPRGHAYP